MALVVHGDDFSALGTDKGLDLYEQGMTRAFECELRGRLGTGPKDLKEVKLLNRIIKVTESGLTYEADPKHVTLLAKALGMEECKNTFTPGVKSYTDAQIADGALSHEDEAQKFIHPLSLSSSRRPKVRFSPKVDIHEVPSYADVFGHHPRRCVLDGVVGAHHLVLLEPGYDPYTGLRRAEVEARRRECWNPDPYRRASKLRDVLCNGPKWEEPTNAIIAAISKKPIRKKFQKRRVGCREAKRLEQLDSCGDVLGPEVQVRGIGHAI